MNKVLAKQLDDALNGTVQGSGQAYARPLRVAADTLLHSNGNINATTVIGIVRADDIQSFEDLVANIAKESGLNARIHVNVGSFSVRFSQHS